MGFTGRTIVDANFLKDKDKEKGKDKDKEI